MTDITQITGERSLFLSEDTINWSLSQFQQAAQFAQQMGFDCVLVKVADGGNRWYGSLAGWQNIRKAILAEGVGAIPYTYSYGNAYGALDTEIDLLIEYMRDCGVVIADMEDKWNGQIAWAQHLCARMQSVPGTFLVSTWADPNEQSWSGVIEALNPCVNAYMPQQYSDWLAGRWAEFGADGAKLIQPTMIIGQSFGPNDPVANARAAYEQGHTAISIWYYELCVANTQLTAQILDAFPVTSSTHSPTPPTPEETIVITLKSPNVGNYYVAAPNGRWRCTKTGATIGGAILAFYCKFGGDRLCGLTYLGLPLTNEIGVGNGRVIQFFERGVLVYDPQHTIDSPVGGADSVYLMHIDRGEGQQLVAKTLIDPLNKDIADLQVKVDALQNNAQLQAMEKALAEISSLAKPYA